MELPTSFLNFRLGTIRPWRPSDQAELSTLANDRSIWRNFRDQFPHPYTESDAGAWLVHAAQSPQLTQCAIESGGRLVGGMGLRVQDDIYAKTALLGYWIGAPFRCQGIASAAVRQYVPWAMSRIGLIRVEARVFGWNTASVRVLVKSGFELEGTRRCAAFKDGVIVDELVYACVGMVGVAGLAGVSLT